MTGDYTLLGWNNNIPPPINAANLNHMDEKIGETDTTVSGHAANLSVLNTTVSGHGVNLGVLNTTVSGHGDNLNTLNTTVSGHGVNLGVLNTTTSGHTTNLDVLNDFRAFDATREYGLNDPTFYNGVPYKSLSAANTGNQPDTSPTFWEVTGGGGSGEGNVGYNFENGQFESSAEGWAVYNDGASAVPVDGTGGTATITFARNAASPLVGTGDGFMTKGAANEQGEGFSYDFSLDRGVVTNTAQIDFIYEMSANYTDNDMGVYLYDITNAVFIPLSVVNLPATYGQPSRFLATFIPSTSTSYRLIFHIQTTNALAYTMKLDDVQVGNQNVAIGAAIGNWVNWIPATKITSLPGDWVAGTKRRQVGSNLEFEGQYQATGAASGLILLSLPNMLAEIGLTFSSANFRFPVTALDSGTTHYAGVWDIGGSFYGPSGQAAWTQTVPFTWASGDAIGFRLSIPIAQWTSNVNLASDFTQYRSHNGTIEEVGVQGSVMLTTTPAGVNETFTLSYTNIGAGDLFVVETQRGGIGPWTQNADLIDPLRFDGSNFIGCGVYYDGTNVKLVRGKYRNGTTNLWSAIVAGTRWRVRKISNGNMAEVPPVVRAEYNKTTLQTGTTTATIIDYNVKVEDTHSAVTVGASWKFTAPISGLYLVSYTNVASIGATSWNYFSVNIYKNNSSFRRIEFTKTDTSSSTAFGLDGAGSSTLRLTAGDYIDLRLLTNANTAANLGAAGSNIQITRIGS